MSTCFPFIVSVGTVFIKPCLNDELCFYLIDMDRQSQQAQQNRTKQCNPNHFPTGPGHQKGYQGDTSQNNLNNHANQNNPNNTLYQPKK